MDYTKQDFIYPLKDIESIDQPTTDKNALTSKEGVIYRISNMVNGKIYIGKTSDTFYCRYKGGNWWKHTKNNFLKEDYHKFGAEAFIVDIIEAGLDSEDLKDLEEFLINSHNSLYPNGYNKVTYSGRKAILSEDSRKRMSESQKALRKRVENPFKGKKHTEESKKLISEKVKQAGYRHTEEHKAMMSKRMSGVNHYGFGKSPSPEARQKMRNSHLGKKLTEEQKEKIRLANLGKCNSKPVYKINKVTKEIIEEYKTITEASLANQISASCISMVCKGKAETAKGFLWKFKK